MLIDPLIPGSMARMTDQPPCFQRMSVERFNAFALWGWDQEMHDQLAIGSCWSTHDERILAAVVHHRETRQFWLAALARDSAGRYRGFTRSGPYPTARVAEDIMSDHRSETLARAQPDFSNFPEPRDGIDLFASQTLQHALHPAYLVLRDGPNQSAARALLTELARWFSDQDGNFVKDYQTTGYSARTWELYLFACMRALGFDVGSEHAVPDFVLSKGEARIFIEAVTANGPDTMTSAMASGAPEGPPEDFWRFIEEDMPLKFGSPLYSKMKKRYWEAPHVRGHPFVLAIADFHAPGSMVWSHTAIPIYLYGTSATVTTDNDGRRAGIEKSVSGWTSGTKTVSEPFFWQPDTEHVSAVLFSNAGTVSKFNRMGVRAGFGDRFVSLLRKGGLNDPHPGAFDPIPFDIDVESPEYREDWVDELEMYHNPNALRPLDEALFPGMAHFRIENGEALWRGPSPRVLFSRTTTIDFLGDEVRAELKDEGKDSRLLGRVAR